MSLKDKWNDIVNGETDVSAQPINEIAHQVIKNEEDIEKLKNMSSQNVSFENTVLGGVDKSVTISDFAIKPIKIKTAIPNTNVVIVSYDANGTIVEASGIFTDSNGEYVYNPNAQEKTVEFSGVICDFTITYYTDINAIIEQVNKNTEDIAQLEENMGDIGSALKRIIEIQNQYIGGDDV